MMPECAAVLGQAQEVIARQRLVGMILIPQAAVGSERDQVVRVWLGRRLEIDQAEAAVDHRDGVGRTAVLIRLRNQGAFLGDRPHVALLAPAAEGLE
jgi:hypothetical protein